MASTITRERIDSGADAVPSLFTSIQYDSLAVRLWRQVSEAAAEFTQNPGRFIAESLRSYSVDRRRRQLLYTGVAVAAVIYAVALTFFLIMGFRKGFSAPRASSEDVVQWIKPTDFKDPASDKATDANGIGGGRVGKGAGGGGGGGQNDPRPASKGAEPQMLPIPQIVKPILTETAPPTLAVPVTVVGPAGPPPPPGPLGVATGVEGPPSPGPGTGGGLGTGTGTGVGSGSGPGAGPGKNGGRGGGGPGLPNGHGDIPSGPLDWRLINNKQGYHKFEWVYRPYPQITPEAAAEQADGSVLLRATFRADGTISDIEVVDPIPHMTQSAIEALQHCKFRPATLYGEPITLTHVLVIVNVRTGVSSR